MARQVDVNKVIQMSLVIGIVLSFVVLLLGSVIFLVIGNHSGLDPTARHLTLHKPGSPLHILVGALRLNAAEVVNLGLFFLLLTPVARVVAAAVGFFLEGDKRYGLVSVAVLIVLALSTLLPFVLKSVEAAH